MAEAQQLLTTFRAAFDQKDGDLDKCEEQLNKLKLLVFSGLATAGDSKERLVARETLELACFLSIRRRDDRLFERHVAQLKMYYTDHQQGLQPSGEMYKILGLFLLHLLASDRIGEFHTELELIGIDNHENAYVKQPIQLERHLMEGNYAKILEAQKEVQEQYTPFFIERLIETVRAKVGASLERSYENVPAAEGAKMLYLSGVPALQEFALKENERKAREEMDDPMGDMTPSLSRRNLAQVKLVRWEVKDSRLYFTRSAEKRLEIPALDLMVNTIGYATDLERIV